MSIKDTPILKSVMALMSKQRSRALARKNCPYLNGRANPLFVGIPYWSGYSDDPDGLYSEWCRRVDMLWAYGHRTSTVPLRSGDGGHKYGLIPMQMVSTVSIRLDSKSWC